jgi:parallel beta-helix repeat protein
MPLDLNDLLKSRYRIETLLGEGGMGAVYRAVDILHEYPCAVKEFRLGHLPSGSNTRGKPEDDSTRLRVGSRSAPVTREKAAEQFLLEAKLLAKLDHANLPRVTDYFEDGGNYYLVMSLIEGRDLALFMEENGEKPIPEQQVLAWLTQVMDALGYCHEQGIIHRDVKPANVIVTAEGKAFLVDFGIAKPNEATTKTTVGARATTAGYSPPEQYGQGRTDNRSDIYAFGAMLYALLTGREPLEAIDRLNGENLPPPQALNGGISSAVAAVIQQAMSLRAVDRFQTIIELKQALLKPSNFSTIRYENMDYSTLEEAIQIAIPGGTISLAAGEYHLSSSLLIQKSLRLAGAGKDATILLSDNEGCSLRYSGKGIFFAEGITFRHSGRNWATVMVVEDGEINLAHCRFTGGVRDSKKHGGMGLSIGGTAGGIIRKCIFDENAGDGIEIKNRAKPVLESNVLRNNFGSGMAYSDAASGFARKNFCEHNGAYGICVSGRARPELFDNQCSGNKIKDFKQGFLANLVHS